MQLVDGKPTSSVPVDDRGLAYGDGVFETIAVREGEPAFLDEHLARLAAGCACLGFAAPRTDHLRDDVYRAVRGESEGVVKIVVTRGSGGRGYRPPAQPVPRRIVACLPPPDLPPAFWFDGVAARLCDTRLPTRPHLAGTKHLNRLEQVLARQEWRDPAIAEGIMLRDNGEPVEGVSSNLFAVIRGRVLTPPVNGYGIEGIIRSFVLRHSEALGMPVLEHRLCLDDVREADEVFLTNSVIGVWPVRSVAGLGRWRPGAVARWLQGQLASRTLMPLRRERA